LPYSAITALWTVMRDTPSRARLQMMAYVGLPHAQIAQLTEQDFDPGAGTLVVQGRRKGAGTATRIVPLTAEGVKAVKAMIRTDAWGPFSRSSLHRDFRAACAKVPALQALAKTLTPYDLRHSFGTEVYRSSGDIRATQILMDHSTPTLTHRYTLAAINPRVAEAVAKFGTPFGTRLELSPVKRRPKTPKRTAKKRTKR
jgi:integrase